MQDGRADPLDDGRHGLGRVLQPDVVGDLVRDVVRPAIEPVMVDALDDDERLDLGHPDDARPADLADHDRVEPDALLGVQVVERADGEPGPAFRRGALDEVQDAPRAGRLEAGRRPGHDRQPARVGLGQPALDHAAAGGGGRVAATLELGEDVALRGQLAESPEEGRLAPQQPAAGTDGDGPVEHRQRLRIGRHAPVTGLRGVEPGDAQGEARVGQQADGVLAQPVAPGRPLELAGDRGAARGSAPPLSHGPPARPRSRRRCARRRGRPRAAAPRPRPGDRRRGSRRPRPARPRARTAGWCRG